MAAFGTLFSLSMKALLRLTAGIVGHPLAAALGFSLLINAWQWHADDAKRRAAAARLAMWQTSFAREQAAFGSLWQSYAQVGSALAAQNGSIRALAAAGAHQHDVAIAALARAVEQTRAMRSRAAAVASDALMAPPNPACRTPAPVLAASAAL